MTARTGIFLWLGALVALWTVGSLIETVRDILRRAYGTHFSKGFFHYRLLSIGIITGAVVLMLLSFSMQVLIVGIEQFVTRFLPEQYQAWGVVLISRSVSGAGLFLAIYMLFRSEEHTSELQSLMRISYAVFCLKKKNINYLINFLSTTSCD